MSFNENLPRWIQASVGDWFKTAATTKNYESLVEEIEERTTQFTHAPQRLEIRLNGPFWRELSKNYFFVDVEVNILIHSYMDGSIDNAYTGTQMAGFMAATAANPIPVFKYGTGVEDDQSQIGCLVLSDNTDKPIRVFHFGEINREDRLRQLGVDISYYMELST